MTLKEKILKLRTTFVHPPSYQEIADKVGCSKTYVAKVIKNNKKKKHER